MIDFNANTKLVYFVFEKKFKKYQNLKDDLCQEGFIALWKACLQFNDLMSEFSTYAIKSIYNNMLSYLLRKEVKHLKNCVSINELENKQIEDVNNSSDEKVNIELLIESISNKMTSKNKEIIKIYIFNELTQKQIAKKFNMSSSNISRIVKKFRNNFNKVIN